MAHVGAGGGGGAAGVNAIPMLGADVRDATIKIINQIGPDAFRVLSAASRNMHDFCMNTAEIKIDWNKGSLGVKKTKEGATQFIFFLESEDAANRTTGISSMFYGMDSFVRGDWQKEPAPKAKKNSNKGSDPFDMASLMAEFMGFMEQGPKRVDVEKLRKMPFIVHLCRLILDKIAVDAPLLEEVEAYLTGIPVKTIQEVKCGNVKCWPEMLNLMTKYKVKDLDVTGDAALPEDTLKAICALNLTSFVYKFDLPAEFITSMTLPNLYLRNDVSLETGKALIQKALSFPEFEEWAFGLDLDEAGFGALFASHELLDFDHSGPLPERRPLVFVQREEEIDEDVGFHYEQPIFSSRFFKTRFVP